jgi:hypothetical protein
MFKISVLVSAGALALAAVTSPAMAQSFSPTNSTTTLSGLLNLEQTQNINCQTTIGVSIDGAGAASVTSRSFSPGNFFFCGLIVQPLGTWTVVAGPNDAGPPAVYRITANVGAQSIAGTCYGEVEGTYNNSTGELTFDNAVIPSSDPQDCIINGSLFASPIITIVP